MDVIVGLTAPLINYHREDNRRRDTRASAAYCRLCFSLIAEKTITARITAPAIIR